ncbi:MAG: TonB-dependent receptor, partial [Bacteroidales bacterium]|nr:TonB-dependent receptor [Bacteroidales bacterium]
VPNPDLKPEYIYNADLGIKQTAFDSKLEVELVAFFSYLDQAMVRSDFTINGSNTIIYDGQESNVQAIVNTGFARIYGLTFDYSYHFSKMLFWNSSFTRISGSDNDGFSIRHAPPLYGQSSINFENNQWKVQLNAFYNGEIAFEDLAPTEADKPDLYAVDENGNPYSPAWFTVNFRSAYQLSNALNLQFEFENILDKRYRTYSSGVAAAGRSFRLSLRYQF